MTTDGSHPNPQRIADSVNSYWNAEHSVAKYGLGYHQGLDEAEDDRIWNDLLQVSFADLEGQALDIGCGSGYMAIRLASLGFDVVGVDQSANMLEQARANARKAGLSIRFVKSVAAEFDVGQDCFSVAVSRWVFWTLPNPLEVAQNVFRALRPGGKFVVFDGLWFKSFDEHNNSAGYW